MAGPCSRFARISCSLRVETFNTRPAARRRRNREVAVRRIAVAAFLLALAVALVGILFAGSRSTLAGGVAIAGVDVGGMTPREAQLLLERRAVALAKTPVRFTAGGKTFRITPAMLGIEGDWRGAVSVARREGDGFAPLRAFRRLHTRVFGEEIAPQLSVYSGALKYELDQIARAVNRRERQASVRRRGLRVEVVPGRPGIALERERAADAIVRTLGLLERSGPFALPVAIRAPRVTAEMLAPAAHTARVAMSAPVRLVNGRTSWRLPRWRIAQLLSLPKNGGRDVAVAGGRADRWFARLAERVNRAPRDATFAVTVGGIRIVPSKKGLALDVAATARALERAAFAPTNRRAELVVHTAQPERTTAEARTMGIEGVVASYTTTYGGTPGRLHNVQLVADLIDNALISPGQTFSFNATTGDRNADKGFQEAPVIINGELQNGIGGGVCQVSTTVFNAAFDAGLPIVDRTNHALYIDHYPLGRDATVNYPDLDLKFRNDTGRWLLLRTFVGSGSLTVNLYGTPQNRRIETETAPLEVTGDVPTKAIKDPALLRGKQVVEQSGSPPRKTSVRRIVYDAGGKLLYDTTWRSYYVAEPTVVRLGTKPPPKRKEPKAETALPGSGEPAVGRGNPAAGEAVPPGGELPATTPEPPTPQR
jgi:vancomycin resistance protein YoaR